jgi:RNA polymerase sigma factor (sigma-70 family)
VAEDVQASRILARLGGAAAAEAWRDFLEAYALIILQVVRLFERDPDHVSDCFLFVCEHLCAGGCRRLRRFQVSGPASFPTWLRAVVRNLCLDWHRREYGRHRDFRVIQRMPALEQAVFERAFRNQATHEEVFLSLRQSFPGLTPAAVADCGARIEAVLSGRQRWLLAVRQARTLPIEEPGETKPAVSLVDPSPGPEEQASSNQQRSALRRALASLPASDLLLLRMRFAEDLTLDQVARLMNLANPQSADRRIQDVLKQLQTLMAQRK